MKVAWRYEDMPRRAGGVSFAPSAGDSSASRAFDMRATVAREAWAGTDVDVARPSAGGKKGDDSATAHTMGGIGTVTAESLGAAIAAIAAKLADRGVAGA
jgi:hypothetical protein